MKSTDLTFGMGMKYVEADVIWGARAILSRNRVQLKTKVVYKTRLELLWDRQSFLGTEDGKKEFSEYLNKKPLKKFIKDVESGKLELSPDWNAPTQLVYDGVRFYCTTSDESGYLYITAVPDNCDKCCKPNNLFRESNYCSSCRVTYQKRIAQDPETSPVGTP